jgi:hypothetical protein
VLPCSCAVLMLERQKCHLVAGVIGQVDIKGAVSYMLTVCCAGD